MNKLEKAIADIHSPSFTSVLTDCDVGSNTRIGETWDGGGHSGFSDDHHKGHRHLIYGHKTDVPTEVSFRNVVDDLKKVGKVINDEVSQIIDAMNASSELVLAFNRTYDALVAEMLAEQASHRRFEQLVQTLDAKVREVRAIYDTIDVAIKKATEDVASSVIKQIEDKGESVTSAMEQDVKRRIEEMLKDVFSEARDNMSNVAAEKTNSVQTELAEMRQQFDSAVDARMQSVKSDMEQQLAQQLEKLLQRGNEHVSRLDDMSLKIDKMGGEIEQRLNDMISAAETKLTMDVRSEVPALFRSNTDGSSFLRRLKWLFFGRV